MLIGMLTAPFRNEPVDNAIRFAAEVGFDALEIATAAGSAHFDAATATPEQMEQLKQKCDAAGLKISSFACYQNYLDPDEEVRRQRSEELKKVIANAAHIGVDVVCALVGMPLPGKSKLETIREEAPKVWPELCAFAAERGVKIALENWFATCLQGLDTFECLFEVVPDENFGLNFDPSHLYWQQIDYLRAVDLFAPRIFHTHAKDTATDRAALAHIGCLARWWRYCIPGFGEINWGEYIGRLRANGINHVLSVEHEDKALGREEGFEKGLRFLRQFA